MGQPARGVLGEIWHIIGPMIEAPFRGGPATWSDDLDLLIEPPRIPRGDALQRRLQPGPRRDRAPTGIGGVLATVRRDDRGRVRRAPAAHAARAGRAARRARRRRAGVRAGGRDAGRQPARRAVRRSSTCSTTTAARRTWPATLRRGASGDVAPPTVALDTPAQAGRSRERRRAAPRRAGRPICASGSRRFRCGAWAEPPHTALALPLPSPEHPRAVRRAGRRASARTARSTTATAASSSWPPAQVVTAIRNATRVRGGAAARRGAGRDRSGQDGVLQQRQPRVPHAADADAGADRGRARRGRRAARRRGAGDRPPQRAAPAEAGQHPARLLAHRGRPRAGVVRADGSGRAHRRSGQRLPLGDRARRARASSSTARRSASRSTSTATCGRRSSSTCSPTPSSSRSRARSR